MIKQYLNSSDVRKLQEQSITMFAEVSSGVYFVTKDRMDIYPSYVNSTAISEALSNRIKIAVSDSQGLTAYANFELLK